MNFNITAVFSPLERAELKRKLTQQKKLEAQLNKVGQQAARSYRSTVHVKRGTGVDRSDRSINRSIDVSIGLIVRIALSPHRRH